MLDLTKYYSVAMLTFEHKGIFEMRIRRGQAEAQQIVDFLQEVIFISEDYFLEREIRIHFPDGSSRVATPEQVANAALEWDWIRVRV